MMIEGYNKIDNTLTDGEIKLLQYVVDAEFFEFYLMQVIKKGAILIFSQDTEHLVYPLVSTFIEKQDYYYKKLLP